MFFNSFINSLITCSIPHFAHMRDFLILDMVSDMCKNMVIACENLSIKNYTQLFKFNFEI